MNEGEVQEGGIPAQAVTEEMVASAVGDFIKKMGGSVSASTTPNVSRWQERDDRRKANARIAREAAQARVARRSGRGLVDRVAEKRTKLDSTNVAGAIQLIQQASPADYDLFIIAERYGQKRAGVLKQFGAPRNSVETAYLAEAGLASPEDTL